MRSLVIIPTYNERENISRLIPAVLEADRELDVLVVDDGSPDGTGELAESFARRTSRVRVLQRGSKQGLATAYVEGFKYALARPYERIIQMDADFSHRPQDLPRLLRAAEGADVVIGSRNIPGGQTENWSPLRNLISKGGSFYARALLKMPIRDCTSGFKCFRREVLEGLDFDSLQSNGFGFQIEANTHATRAGFRIVEVPIVFSDRIAGRSKMSWQIFLEALTLVWKLRSQQAPTISTAPRKSLVPVRSLTPSPSHSEG
jgi:dolichol-phosphate mannosyltransferase